MRVFFIDAGRLRHDALHLLPDILCDSCCRSVTEQVRAGRHKDFRCPILKSGSREELDHEVHVTGFQSVHSIEHSEIHPSLIRQCVRDILDGCSIVQDRCHEQNTEIRKGCVMDQLFIMPAPVDFHSADHDVAFLIRCNRCRVDSLLCLQVSNTPPYLSFVVQKDDQTFSAFYLPHNLVIQLTDIWSPAMGIADLQTPEGSHWYFISIFISSDAVDDLVKVMAGYFSSCPCQVDDRPAVVYNAFRHVMNSLDGRHAVIFRVLHLLCFIDCKDSIPCEGALLTGKKFRKAVALVVYDAVHTRPADVDPVALCPCYRNDIFLCPGRVREIIGTILFRCQRIRDQQDQTDAILAAPLSELC